MGYTAVKAQLMMFPPYAVAVVSCLSFCMLSDRFKHRYGFLIGGVLLGTLGYGILLAQKANPSMPLGLKYFALFPLISSPQIVQPLTVAWMMNNVVSFPTTSRWPTSGVLTAMITGRTLQACLCQCRPNRIWQWRRYYCQQHLLHR